MGIKRIGGGMAVNQITEGVIWKQLLYFFFPILFGTFFQQLYNTADAVIVGQFVGTQALAAVGGATGSLINLFVNLFVGLASGTTVVIAQAYGAHDAESVGGTVHTSVALALAAGLGLTAVGVAAAPWALSAMGTPADIMDFALIYLRVYMLGTIPSFLYNVGSGILRAVGDTRRPLYFLIIACLVNIALDVVLVAVLGMGVLGAALATIFSQGVSAVLVLVSLTRAETVYRLDWKQVRFHGRLLGDILHGHSGGLDGARQGGRLLLDDIGRVRYFHHHLCRAELRRAEVRPHPQERTGVPCAWLRQRCADERAVLLSGAVSAGPVHQGRRGGVHRPGHGAAAGAVLLHICLH